MLLSWYSVCLAWTTSWVISIAAHIITMLSQACDLSTQEKAGGSEVQDSPQLLIKFKASWATWNPVSAEKKNKEIIRNVTLVSVLGAQSQRAGPCMKLKSSCSSNLHSTKRPGLKGMEWEGRSIWSWGHGSVSQAWPLKHLQRHSSGKKTTQKTILQIVPERFKSGEYISLQIEKVKYFPFVALTF